MLLVFIFHNRSADSYMTILVNFPKSTFLCIYHFSLPQYSVDLGKPNYSTDSCELTIDCYHYFLPFF